jgi:hypothetical protein
MGGAILEEVCIGEAIQKNEFILKSLIFFKKYLNCDFINFVVVGLWQKKNNSF